MQLKNYFSANLIYKDGSFQNLSYAKGEGKCLLTFCDSINYLNLALSNKSITAVITKKSLIAKIEDKNITIGVALDDNPRNKFFTIYNKLQADNYFKNNFKYGIAESAIVASSAIVSTNSYIGKNSIIADNVVIKEGVFIGDNCFIDSGAIIGNDGILWVKDSNNQHTHIRHCGAVKIGSNVSILANAVVVRSIFPNMPTIVDDHCIIGISTTIGHEVVVSKNCIVSGSCVLAKNVNIGKGSIIGAMSFIRENITVGSKADIKAGSVVVKNVAKGEAVSGNFAINHNQNIKNYLNNIK